MLSVKKIYAGRGAVDYHLNQTRRGLADYSLPEPDERAAAVGDERSRLSAPGSTWWGGGVATLGLPACGTARSRRRSRYPCCERRVTGESSGRYG